MLSVDVVLKGTQEEIDQIAIDVLDHLRGKYGLLFAGVDALTAGMTTLSFKEPPAGLITPATLAAYHIPYGANFLLKHIRARGLVEVLQYILKHNTSADLPYHNTEHILGMTSIAIRLFMSQHSAEDIDVLITAGLFHDFGHSGGVKPDTANIEHACMVAREYLAKAERHEDFIERVIRAIRCTVFPFAVEPDGWVEQCLRDADVLYTALVGEPELVIEKLRSEVEVSLGRSLCYQEFYDGQVAFVEKAILYTPVGKELFELHGRTLLNDMRLYIDQHANLA